MIRIVALYGTGDCYLVCALARAFEREHKIEPVVVAKASHGAIPEMFGVRWQLDEDLVRHGEGNLQQCWAHYENRIVDGATFFAHPHFVRSGARLDQLTLKWRASQADMYRAILHLSPWAPLDKPTPPQVERCGGALVITEARSWPNLPPEFWSALVGQLRARGIAVAVNDRSRPLSDLLQDCAAADWIVGPQCGTMAMACEMGLPARKILVARDLADCPYLFGLTESMPYGHCSTFAGTDHPDVDHFVVPAAAWEPRIEDIVERCRR